MRYKLFSERIRRVQDTMKACVYLVTCGEVNFTQLQFMANPAGCPSLKATEKTFYLCIYSTERHASHSMKLVERCRKPQELKTCFESLHGEVHCGLPQLNHTKPQPQDIHEFNKKKYILTSFERLKMACVVNCNLKTLSPL